MAKYSTARHVINLLLILLGVWLVLAGVMAIVTGASYFKVLINPVLLKLTVFMTLLVYISYICDYISALGEEKEKEFRERLRQL